MADLPFVDTHVHFYDLRRKDLVYEWLQPEFVHPILGDINSIKTLVFSADAFLAESRFANVIKTVHVQAAIGAADRRCGPPTRQLLRGHKRADRCKIFGDSFLPFHL